MNQKKIVSIIVFLGLLFGFVNFVPAAATEACSSSGEPLVITDQEDYSPFDTATITGTGFGCGVELSVLVTAPDGSMLSGGGTGASGPDAVITDDYGGFILSYQLYGTLPDGNLYIGQQGQYMVQVLDASGAILADATFSDALGGTHSCAQLESGQVKCWGWNYYGQLGDGTTSTLSTIPVNVIGLDGVDVAQIGAGYHHTCVLTETGGVKCWGYNDYGQLGDKTNSHKRVPVDVIGLDSNVIQITGGQLHTCALMVGGGIKCWGAGGSGQLGGGTIANSSVPVDVVGMTGAIQVSAGGSHTCALMSDHTVMCWGNNSFGQLGDNSTNWSSVPVPVHNLASVIQIELGLNHSCAVINDGSVKCWGENFYGQLGNNTTNTGRIPVSVIGIDDAAQVGAGNAFTCVLTQAGSIKCWGRNSFGSLGDGTLTNRLLPVDVIGLNGQVDQLSVAGWHNCALSTSGGVQCWGHNAFGQIGNNTSNPVFPYAVPVPAGVYGMAEGVSALPDAPSITPNQPPVAYAGGPYFGNEGAAIVLGGAHAVDPDDDGLLISWSVDTGLCSFSDPGALNPELICSDDGSFNATFTVDDGINPPVSSSASVTMNNLSPTASLGNGGPIDEGGSAVISFSDASDPSSEDAAAGFHYAFDCNGGSLATMIYADSGEGSSTSCTFANNGSYTVSGKIMDKDGGSNVYATIVSVNNLAPMLGSILVDQPLVQVNTVINASAVFTDTGVLDTHTAVWDWGDTQTSSGSITESSGSGTASANHSYSEPGVYIIKLIVTDNDGAPSNEAIYQYVVVYDPTAGFVSGGGWINSPAGAYFSDPTLTGKATFGFVSRYKKGAVVPSGETWFQFHAAGFNFRSISYQWLVVNQAGTDAQFKGLGMLNGALAPNGSAYKFMIWAKDLDPTVDTFRIKIWYEEGDLEIVVYDNGFDQTIGGGQIQIHTN